MLKRLCLAFAGLFAFVSIANGAGTVPGFSLTPQFDLTGKIAPGCRLYVIQAGTTSTPQNSYQDTGLTLTQPNPLLCDAGGRIPQFFVADGLIKLRLTDRNGVQLFVGDNLLVVGPSSGGGGGGGTVDPTTVMQTGHLELFYGTGVLTGFVRCNGRTIGAASSGASERANSDTQALFSYLWNADTNLAVSGGRGASPAADFAANKTIALPDCRGRVIASIDGAGSTTTGRLTSSYFGSTATVLGASGGAESKTLLTANLPPYTPSGTPTVNMLSTFGGNPINTFTAGGCCVGFGGTSTGATAQNISGVALPSSFLGNAQGGTSAPFANVQPTILASVYLKL